MSSASESKSIHRTNYIIKYPDFKGRANFSLLKVEQKKDGSREFERIENDRINSINIDWQSSKQTKSKRDELLKLVKEIRAGLNHTVKIKSGKARLIKFVDNQKILDDFIEERINDRPLISPGSQIADYTRAVLYIDTHNLSLKTASKKELQKAINKTEENNKHRRICSRINSLLRFMGRRERVEPLEYIETPFIFSEEEFLIIVENMEVPTGLEEHLESIKNLFYCLFYTGMRMGEAFALYPKLAIDPKTGRKLNFISGNQIAVNSQMKKCSLKVTRTKNKRERIAYVVQNKIARVRKWAELPKETKEKLRNIEYSRLFKKAASISFPSNTEMSRIRAHDCRHSYAVYLLNRGVTISLIAKTLGNSIGVCEKYYTGYVLQEEGLQMIHLQMQKQTL